MIKMIISRLLQGIVVIIGVTLLDYSIMSEKRNTRTISELNFIGLGRYLSGVGELAWPP